MQNTIQKFSTSLGLLGWMLFGSQGTTFAASAADADTCTAISSVPFTISSGGAYCLTKDIATPATFTTGNAITISGNDVVLDLGGHTLGNLAAGTGTQANGIYALDQRNITVRNGTVRGFYVGVNLVANAANNGVSSSGHLVENVRADQNRFTGIQVLGTGSVARQNQVLHTGGSTSVVIFGIQIGGDGSRAVDNDVIDTVAPAGGVSWGILAGPGYNMTGSMVEGNRISNQVQTAGATTRGIQLGGGAFAHDCIVVNNRITKMDGGIVFDGGADGTYRDNLTFGVTTPYSGGTNAGNNQ